MTQMQFATLMCVLLLPALGLLACSVAMLERIEKHLRALHVDALGPLKDRDSEAMRQRREELGLNDGYPHRQQRTAVTAVATTLLMIYLGTTFWP